MLTCCAGTPALAMARETAGGSWAPCTRPCVPSARSAASAVRRLSITKTFGQKRCERKFILRATRSWARSGAAMRRLWNTFLKGLVAVLPVTLTVYLVWWLGSTAERILSGPLRALLPADKYWPGLGPVV